MITLPQCSGDVSLASGDGVRVRLDLNLTEPIENTDVLKVYVSSACLPDIYLGIADITGRKCLFEGKADTKDEDAYDTVTVVKKNAFTELTSPFIKVCFSDEDKATEKLEYLQSHSAYKDYLSVAHTLKSPVERGGEALDAFRISRQCIHGEREKCIKRMKDILSTLPKADFSLADGFEWHRADIFLLYDISTATEHILSSPYVSASVSRYGHIIAGLNRDTDTLCIAIPEDSPRFNPIPHLSDCTVFIKPPRSDLYYCTVGVMFAPDGQYFVRLDEQDFS